MNEDEIDDIIKEMQEQQAQASASAKTDEIVLSTLHTLTKTSANNTSRPWSVLVIRPRVDCRTSRLWGVPATRPRADWQPSSSDWEREGVLRANGSQVSEQLSLENEMVKKLGRMIAGLSIKKESLSPCTKKETEWTKLSLVVDSGACESVIDAAEQLPGYPIMETKASRSGLTYASATGEDILNLGEVRVPMMTRESTKRSMKLQAAEVARPLASVKRICEAGHTVTFDDEGSYIIKKDTGEINYLREDSGNYMFDVWIPPSSSVPTFQRP